MHQHRHVKIRGPRYSLKRPLKRERSSTQSGNLHPMIAYVSLCASICLGLAQGQGVRRLADPAPGPSLEIFQVLPLLGAGYIRHTSTGSCW